MPKRGQPFGTKSREFCGDLVHRKEVTIIDQGKDRYGRTLVDILLPDGRNLSHDLVKAGFVWWNHNAKDNPILPELEAEAKAARRGLWADEHPVAPREWRKREAEKRRKK